MAGQPPRLTMYVLPPVKTMPVLAQPHTTSAAEKPNVNVNLFNVFIRINVQVLERMRKDPQQNTKNKQTPKREPLSNRRAAWRLANRQNPGQKKTFGEPAQHRAIAHATSPPRALCTWTLKLSVS